MRVTNRPDQPSLESRVFQQAGGPNLVGRETVLPELAAKRFHIGKEAHGQKIGLPQIEPPLFEAIAQRLPRVGVIVACLEHGMRVAEKGRAQTLRVVSGMFGNMAHCDTDSN